MIKECTLVAASETESGEQKIRKTLIDHFSTSCPKYIFETNIIKTGMVDHYLVYEIRKINAWRRNNPRQRKVVEFRNLKKYDKMLFRQDLQQIDWETILSPFNVDPSSIATTFLEIFESILNSYAPLGRKRVRNDFAPWLSASLRKLMLIKKGQNEEISRIISRNVVIIQTVA